MIRQMNEPTLQYIQENQAMLTHLREIAQGFDMSGLNINTSAMAAALKPGLCRNIRSACLRSWRNVSIDWASFR